MENIQAFFQNISKSQIIASILVILISFIIYKGIIFFLTKGEARGKSKIFTSNKGKTYIKFMKNIIRYVFAIVTILIVLQINGIDVSSILAGVGIAGVVFGLAIQDWLKDIIRGSSILSDDYFSVGDIIKYKDIEGKVLVIGLKTTKIMDIRNSNIISIANRNIEEVDVVSNRIFLEVPMPYELNVEESERIVKEIIEKVKENNNVDDCIYKSVNQLDSSSINYYIEINCNPELKPQVRRDAIRSILLVMNKNNISVPYTQIDVHQK